MSHGFLLEGWPFLKPLAMKMHMEAQFEALIKYLAYLVVKHKRNVVCNGMILLWNNSLKD